MIDDTKVQTHQSVANHPSYRYSHRDTYGISGGSLKASTIGITEESKDCHTGSSSTKSLLKTTTGYPAVTPQVILKGINWPLALYLGGIVVLVVVVIL